MSGSRGPKNNPPPPPSPYAIGPLPRSSYAIGPPPPSPYAVDHASTAPEPKEFGKGSDWSPFDALRLRTPKVDNPKVEASRVEPMLGNRHDTASNISKLKEIDTVTTEPERRQRKLWDEETNERTKEMRERHQEEEKSGRKRNAQDDSSTGKKKQGSREK